MATERPGLLALIGAALRGPLEERYYARRLREAEASTLTTIERIQQEAASLVRDEEPGWTKVADLQDRRSLDDATAAEFRQGALKASLTSPLMMGYLRTLVRFVMGRGADVSVETDDQELQAACAEHFKAFHRANNWDVFEDELPHRLWRDGEVFIRKVELETGRGSDDVQLDPAVEKRLVAVGGQVAALEGPAYDAGTVLLRFLAAEDVQDPENVISHGIVTDNRDVQTVLAYLWAPAGGTGSASAKPEVKEVIPAAEVLHAKIRVDADVKRGRSMLEPLLPRDTDYNNWLRYRLLLNLARTAIVMIKRIAGTPTQVQGLRNAQQTQRETEPTGNQNRLRMLKPLTTIHASQGIEYELLSPNLAAQDAQADGRALQLTMAAATGMPEYIFTGDASNANYASTLVAEGPGMREFEYWQDFLTGIWVQLHRWALVAGARAGVIKGLQETQAQTLPIQVSWPPLLSRDDLKQAQATEIDVGLGILSKEGAARRRGIDWEVEKERLLQEAKELAQAMADERTRLANAGAAGGGAGGGVPSPAGVA